MPELPEVEQFRWLLEPLVHDSQCLKLERCSLDKKPPRKFLSDEDIRYVNEGGYVVSEVKRKGKQICLVLQSTYSKKTSKKEQEARYLYVHMGMNGRISTPDSIPRLKELKDTSDFPPPHTHLSFKVGSHQACFSDPRKFGHVLLKDSLQKDFDSLAPDAWTDLDALALDPAANNPVVSCPITAGVLSKLTGNSIGIKALLLDQKRAVCGVGNWVADEVLYQCEMHPDQNYLSADQAKELLYKLHSILDEAITCLSKSLEFPSEWLFHHRWDNKGNGTTTVDAMGRTVIFVTSGGRTSAVLKTLRKKKPLQNNPNETTKPVKRTATEDVRVKKTKKLR